MYLPVPAVLLLTIAVNVFAAKLSVHEEIDLYWCQARMNTGICSASLE